MSDDERNSDGDHTLNGNSGDNICRDYLRNVCRRGSSCKFKHPEGNEADQLGKKMEYVFCHDYQNRECHRINCKFMHCTRQEEQQYRTTGELPKHCIDAMNGGKGMSGDGGKNETPVCKDYLKGDCRRGNRCKFRHVDNNEYEMEMGNGRGRRDRFDRFDRFDNFEFEPEAKRRAFDEPYHPSIMDRGGMGLGSGGSLGGHGMGVPPYHNFRMLEEENLVLRRKVEELKKQITDLTATNEFLLDQNAQLRLNKQSSVSHSMASMSQMSMNNSDLAARTMATELGVPVTMGQGMSASMASMGQGLPSVSMAQNMMTMSTPSTNLVSYPIMTQSMRPIIPHGHGHGHGGHGHGHGHGMGH